MKKHSKQDQIILAKAAADWARHVLPLFEKAAPTDHRPRLAIREGRRWARTLDFEMSRIRGAALAAHGAARKMKSIEPASLAAHAAGQAVATAHVPQHAYGAAYYALRAIAASRPRHLENVVRNERLWQAGRLPPRLRREFLARLTIQVKGDRALIKLNKGSGF